MVMGGDAAVVTPGSPAIGGPGNISSRPAHATSATAPSPSEPALQVIVLVSQGSMTCLSFDPLSPCTPMARPYCVAAVLCLPFMAVPAAPSAYLAPTNTSKPPARSSAMVSHCTTSPSSCVGKNSSTSQPGALDRGGSSLLFQAPRCTIHNLEIHQDR